MQNNCNILFICLASYGIPIPYFFLVKTFIKHENGIGIHLPTFL